MFKVLSTLKCTFTNLSIAHFNQRIAKFLYELFPFINANNVKEHWQSDFI